MSIEYVWLSKSQTHSTEIYACILRVTGHMETKSLDIFSKLSIKRLSFIKRLNFVFPFTGTSLILYLLWLWRQIRHMFQMALYSREPLRTRVLSELCRISETFDEIHPLYLFAYSQGNPTLLVFRRN